MAIPWRSISWNHSLLLEAFVESNSKVIHNINLMAKYVDGFVLVVPEKKLKDYKKMAMIGAKVWRKHGALDYKECVGQDLQPTGMGDLVPFFPKMTGLKKGELIIFSFIVFKSRRHRDQVNAKVMKDPAMSSENWKDKPMPFDMKRMAYAGFEVFVEL